MFEYSNSQTTKKPDELTGKTAKNMKKRDTILVYVAKIDSSEAGGKFVIQNNIDDSYYRWIPTRLPDNEIIEQAKNILIDLLTVVMDKRETLDKKQQFMIVFNKEYSVIGFAHSEDFNNKIFRYVNEVELKKPIGDAEILLFLKAVKRIPVFK